MTEPTCIFQARDKLGEAVTWDAEARCLWWVDVPMPARIHCLDPATGEHREWPAPEMVASLAPLADGRLLVASHHGLNVFDPTDGTLRCVAAPEADKPANRSNDGGTDPRGRFWFGTMRNNIAPDGTYLDVPESVGSLYRVGADLVPTRMAGVIGIPNSIAWSPDGRTMYFADTLASAIYAYDFDPDLGALWNRRVFAAPEGRGYPDGSCVDAEGFLWNARWEGGCVIRFAPDGRIDRVVEIPAQRVTCCAFGGDDLATLFVTTSRLHLSEDELRSQPDAGGLFAVRPGVRGRPANRFQMT
jgi:sugar lactone lactonase YvrE